jgi:hypothetical protein
MEPAVHRHRIQARWRSSTPDGELHGPPRAARRRREREREEVAAHVPSREGGRSSIAGLARRRRPASGEGDPAGDPRAASPREWRGSGVPAREGGRPPDPRTAVTSRVEREIRPGDPCAADAPRVEREVCLRWREREWRGCGWWRERGSGRGCACGGERERGSGQDACGWEAPLGWDGSTKP